MASITINGVTIACGGQISVIDGKVIVDGQNVTPEGKTINITVNGNIEKLECSEGSILVNGGVGEIHSRSGNVTCGNVTGSVEARSGNVYCSNVGGNVTSRSGDISYRK